MKKLKQTAKVEKDPVFLKITITPDIYRQIRDFKAKWRRHNIEASELMLRIEMGGGRAVEAITTLSLFMEALGLKKEDNQLKLLDVNMVGENVPGEQE